MFRTPHKDLLEEWPVHYFETDDIHEREEALNQRIAATSDPEDVRRLEVLHLRYGTGKRQRPDGFMRAWLMLKVMAVNSGNSPFSRKKHQEVYALLESFGIREGETPDEVLIAEWRDFSARMIRSCAGDRAYRTTGFGLVPVSEEHTARHIAEDIQKTMKDLPASLGLGKLADPLYQVLAETYAELMEHGDQYLNQAGRR
ncbi:MAG: DUF6553 family protein [Bulleidia sp.]